MLLALALLASTLQDTPIYDGWKGLKAGSSVKVKIERGGLEAEITFKLLSISAEKAVVEGRGKTRVGGKQVDVPPEKTTHKAGETGADKVEKEVEEELEVGGKTLKCRVLDCSSPPIEGLPPRRKKFWMSPEVPGGIAKSEIYEGDQLKTRSVALSWERK